MSAIGETGRFFVAFRIPAVTFSREKGSVEPSRLRTISPTLSTRS